LAEEIATARGYIAASRASATRTAHAADWRRFEAWCRLREAATLPADPALVAVHFASLAAHGLTPPSIARALGAVAQLERALIAERTKSGLRAARARGRVGGNPGRRAGNPDAIRKVRARRDAAHLDGVLAQLDSWLPIVRRMRPDQPWGDVVRVLNRGHDRKGGTATWTAERLRRTVRQLAAEGIIEATLLDRARPEPSDGRLIRLVAGIKAAAPDRTLQQIATQLEAMHERTPRGGTRWHPSPTSSTCWSRQSASVWLEPHKPPPQRPPPGSGDNPDSLGAPHVDDDRGKSLAS